MQKNADGFNSTIYFGPKPPVRAKEAMLATLRVKKLVPSNPANVTARLSMELNKTWRPARSSWPEVRHISYINDLHTRSPFK